MLKHPKQNWHQPNWPQPGKTPITNQSRHLYIPSAAIVNIQNGTFEPLNVVAASATIGGQIPIHQAPNLISNQTFIIDQQQQQQIFATQQQVVLQKQQQRKISSHSLLSTATNFIGNLRKSSHNNSIVTQQLQFVALKSPLLKKMPPKSRFKFDSSCDHLLSSNRPTFSGEKIVEMSPHRKSSAPSSNFVVNPFINNNKKSFFTKSNDEILKSNFLNFQSQV